MRTPACRAFRRLRDALPETSRQPFGSRSPDLSAGEALQRSVATSGRRVVAERGSGQAPFEGLVPLPRWCRIGARHTRCCVALFQNTSTCFLLSCRCVSCRRYAHTDGWADNSAAGVRRTRTLDFDDELERFARELPRIQRLNDEAALEKARDITPRGLTHESILDDTVPGGTPVEAARRSHRRFPTTRFYYAKRHRRLHIDLRSPRYIERWWEQRIASRKRPPLDLAHEIRRARRAARVLKRRLGTSVREGQQLCEAWLRPDAWPTGSDPECHALEGAWTDLQESVVALVAFKKRFLLRPFARFAIAFADLLDTGNAFFVDLAKAVRKKGQWSQSERWEAGWWELCTRIALYFSRFAKRPRTPRELRRLMVLAIVNYEHLRTGVRTQDRDAARHWVRANGW